MTRSVSAYKGGYKLDNPGNTDLDKLLGNYVVLLNHAAGAEGIDTEASGLASHAEGNGSRAGGAASHAEGFSTTANALASHAEGSSTSALGEASHAEGRLTYSSGAAAHAEGFGTLVTADWGHAEGAYTSAAKAAHAEGFSTIAGGEASHAEGNATIASGEASHAEGFQSRAVGLADHAEGHSSEASGGLSHAAGLGSKALAARSRAVGAYALARREGECVSANYWFNAEVGSCNRIEVSLGGRTVDATRTELFLDAERTQRLTMAAQVAALFEIDLLASRDGTLNKLAAWDKIRGTIANNGVVTRIVGMVRVSDNTSLTPGADLAANSKVGDETVGAWKLRVSTSANNLVLEVTGEAGSTVRWHAAVRMIELANISGSGGSYSGSSY